MKTLTLLNLLNTSPAMAQDTPAYTLDAPIISNEQHFPSLVREKMFQKSIRKGKFKFNSTTYNLPHQESATLEFSYRIGNFQGTFFSDIKPRELIINPGFMLETTLLPNVELTIGTIKQEETQHFTGIKIKF